MNGRVTFVGAGPGDPDLITVRGLRALQSADVVLYDNLMDARILDDAGGQLIYVGKRCGQQPARLVHANHQRIAAGTRDRAFAHPGGRSPCDPRRWPGRA